MSEVLENEKKYLKLVKSAIGNDIDHCNMELVEIPFRYKNRYANAKGGDEDIIAEMTKNIINRINGLKGIISRPYFGRIDFCEDGKSEVARLYIGKMAIYDENRDLLTIDWRAPICTLYYDQSVGRVSYVAPQGVVTGDLKLKTQIIIENGEIVSVSDTDLVTDDELIRPFLTTNADSRMKSIVASIQREQNSIIRRPLRDNIIVQGVAGSGKTTVALHRIAYLIYNEEKHSARNYAVIGPNKYFLNYISAILPDLDTANVTQYTFDEIAGEILGTDMKGLSVRKTSSSDSRSASIAKFKTTMDYKSAVVRFLKEFILSNLNEGIEIDGVELVSASYIRSKFKGVMGYLEVADTVSKALIQSIKADFNKIYDEIYQKYNQRYNKPQRGTFEHKEMFTKLAEIEAQLKNGCSALVKAYFKNLKQSSVNMYKMFVSNINNYVQSPDIDTAYLVEETLGNFKKRQLAEEDLPALMYLKMAASGFKGFDNYVQIAIDEAQDYGMFHFYMFKMIFKNASFSIYGDLAQSIRSYNSIESWEAVNELMFDSEGIIVPLNKSYRTTIEITHVANNILRYINLKEAEPVIRHGALVNTTKIESNIRKGTILMKIDEWLLKGYKSIAIICRDEGEVKKVQACFKGTTINPTVVSQNDQTYDGGICILTSRLAKGLEFDAVIISDASENIYSSDSRLDMNLLYVALTRALHELEIMHTDSLVKPLDKSKSFNMGTIPTN